MSLSHLINISILSHLLSALTKYPFMEPTTSYPNIIPILEDKWHERKAKNEMAYLIVEVWKRNAIKKKGRKYTSYKNTTKTLNAPNLQRLIVPTFWEDGWKTRKNWKPPCPSYLAKNARNP